MQAALERAVEHPKDCYAVSVENGMDALEARGEAKRQHLFLPSEQRRRGRFN